MFYRCENESRKLEVCLREYFRVHVRIIASKSQQISGPLTSISRTFQDQNHFPGLYRSWKFSQNIPGLSRRHGNPGQTTNTDMIVSASSCGSRRLCDVVILTFGGSSHVSAQISIYCHSLNIQRNYTRNSSSFTQSSVVVFVCLSRTYTWTWNVNQMHHSWCCAHYIEPCN